MCSGLFQKYPKVEQCSDAPRFYECCTPELHVLCNFASSLHSIEDLDHEAYMQHIYTPPNQRPVTYSLSYYMNF